MLTPVDIQQKKFHVGLGYDKKDVNTFFDSVAESYEQLYRSNAELKEKVNVLNDTLQHYKTKETSLNKSLLRAEKDTEETISKASKEAKNIIRDAKNQAQNIVADAEKKLERMKDEIAVIEAKYAAYKSNFCTLMKQQFAFLGENDFDPKAMIDDRAWGLLGAGVAQTQQSAAADNSLSGFEGDPQMRDESTLGGGLTGGYGGGDVTSSSAVYTQSLAAGENFVDPFAPKEEKEYDPFEKKEGNENKTNLKVSNSAEERKKMKRATVGSAEAKAAAEKAKEVAQGVNEMPKSEPKVEPEPKPEVKPEPKPEVKPEPKPEVKPEPKPEVKQESKPEVKEEPVSSIPTVDFGSSSNTDEEPTEETTTSSDDDELVGEVEEKKSGTALIGEAEDDADTDDDGFEFV